MDNKYLNKVVGQLVSETEIDYENTEIDAPFLSPFLSSHTLPPLSTSLFSSLLTSPPTLLFSFFSDHCRDIYGLTEKETQYVWGKYINIIKDKIKNGY